MNKNITNTKKITLTVLLIAILAVGGFLGYRALIEKRTAEDMAVIDELYEQFEHEELREEKLVCLLNMTAQAESYEKKDKTYKKVTKEYESKIKAMRQYFMDEYDESIEANTIKDLKKTMSTLTINKTIAELDNLLWLIKSEENLISDWKTVEKYEKTISALIESYEKRREEIMENKTTKYENEYFTVKVPKSWKEKWSVTEDDKSSNGVHGVMYMFSQHAVEFAGGAAVYVLDMDYSADKPISAYSEIIPENSEYLGETSKGYHVFVSEAGMGFFIDGVEMRLK